MSKIFLKLTIFSFIISSHLFSSEKFSFFYSGMEGQNRIYLSCQYVESSVEEMMKKIGATNIDVTCSGGINPTWISPISGQVKFELPATQIVAEIKSDFNSNCFFDINFLNTFFKKFKNNFILSKKTSHCFAADSLYSFKFESK